MADDKFHLTNQDETLPLLNVDLNRPVSRNPAVVYISGLTSEHSRRGMISNLDRAARILTGNQLASYQNVPWANLRFAHIRALQARMYDMGLAPSTVKVTLAAVRGVMQAAFDLEQISGDDLLRIQRVKPPRGRGSRQARGRCLSPLEVDRLFRACRDGSPAGVRDQAVLAILFGCGLRREEIAKLALEAYNPEDPSLRYIGKGNVELVKYLPQGAQRALDAWLDIRSMEPGRMFCSINKVGRLCSLEAGLSSQAIYNIMKKRYQLAGIRACSPHDGRRTFVTWLIEKTNDLTLVQKIVGHSNPATTAIYDRRADAAKKKAVDTLEIPFYPS